jgi:flagellar M-ring protein FliF
MPLLENWRKLSARNQIAAIVAALAVIGVGTVLFRAATMPPLTLLYAGLDSAAAGEILTTLEQQGVRAEARGDAIFVPADRRDALRMSLARDGLPRQGQAGFELLDEMNGFSTSSEMFDATYWRAKEGELARTILASPGVRIARVHIAAPKRAAFSRDAQRASASVTVSMARGALGPEQAMAMRFVVALAVPGLAAENVAVIDSDRGVVLAPGANDMLAASGAEIDQERALERSLIDLLEARVGVGNARVKVSIELSRDQATLFERTIDPQTRMVTRSESNNANEAGSDGSGVVTVASNLPEGDSEASTAAGRRERNESREALQFDASERRLETVTAPGARKRVQVAAMINEIPQRNDEDETIFEPRTPEELKALQNLIAAAVGFDSERGDVVTVESLAFDLPESAGEEVKRNGVMDFLSANAMGIMQLVIPAIVTIILALFVLKPLLTSGAASSSPTAALPPPTSTPTATTAALAATPQLTPVEEMSRIAAERRPEATALLADWLDEKGAAA